MSVEELARKVNSDVYAAAVKHFEAAEHAGLIIGNGHHMAQDIAEKAKNLPLERCRVSGAWRGPGEIQRP